MTHWLCVVVHTPAHASLGTGLSYQSELPLPPGTLVRVPLGKRELLGVVWDGDTAQATGEIDPGKIKAIAGTLEGIAPLSASWQQLVTFAANYYQRALGEVALAALPPQLRELNPTQMARRLKRPTPVGHDPDGATERAPQPAVPPLTAEQAAVLASIAAQPGPFLLFGATGSGKTEVYLRCVQQLLDADPHAQALLMVPEINLTPQLEARVKARFAPLVGEHAVVSLHSGMTNPQRLKAWLAAHSGAARIVLGTRMAVFAPLPRLGLVVVDEEHDPSYKQQEGARYSARDLAIYRAHLERVPVILGSATPALETWQRAEEGKYQRLTMAARIGGGVLPRVRLFDMGVLPKDSRGQSPVLAPMVLASLQERIDRGEQSLVFLNRRGYAPVLHCADCGWKSGCPHCSAWRVFHKAERTLRCHHCGFTERVPRACPDCGNLDIAPIGRGTEKLEE
ncbi:MAG: primosomal protein N', partial [Burkholderiales bacterium PBB4]